MLNKAHFHSLSELKNMELENLIQLEKEVLEYYKDTREAYYHFGISNIDGEEELELYLNRIQHILWGNCLENENR